MSTDTTKRPADKTASGLPRHSDPPKIQQQFDALDRLFNEALRGADK